MKWLLQIILLTIYFILLSFCLDADLRFSFRFMTIGMSIVSFLFYFIIYQSQKKNVKKALGGNLAAIVIKYMLSASVIIIYAFKYGMNFYHEFIYFFAAYLSFSVICYLGAYNYNKK